MSGVQNREREVVGRVNLSADDALAPAPTSDVDARESLSIQKFGLGIAALILMAIFLFIIVQGVFQTGV